MIGRKHFSRVDELFDAALDRPLEERLQFVEDACRGDAELAEEVRNLLELSSEEDSLFPSGAMKGPLWDEVARELEHGGDAELGPGARVGPYEIVALIGRGGMGTVYRASDPSLGREVAIKALSRAFATDESTLKRFEREAKTLASLNHPNIASIYDILHVDDKRYLVLELVEGETLAERFARGPLKLPVLYDLAGQIAEALAEAHRKGVMHRDLKPSNIKLTRDGRIKVLDFGLAKTHVGPADDEDLTQTALPTAPTTQAGVVLGTPGYMSPEQARGTTVDKRTDVWAFGCILYEMLTGRRAFTGQTPSDAIAAVLRDEVDWTRIPIGTPPDLKRLISRCLQQNPRDRVQDIGDARLEIVELARETSHGVPPVSDSRARSRWVALAALAAFFAGMAFYRAVGVNRSFRSRAPVTRTTMALGPEERLWLGASSSLALAPDGSRIALVADVGGRIQLYLRALDSFAIAVVRGSDGARDPFFSADGEWVGFFAQGEMKKVSVERGIAESLTQASLQSRGASWRDDGQIVFAQDGVPGLSLVSDGGGDARPVSYRDTPAGTEEHLWPQWIAGRDAILFTRRVSEESGATDQLAVVRTDTGEVVILGEGSQGRYLPSGHVIYVRDGSLEAAVFDPSSLELRSAGTPLVEGVNAYPNGAATFAVSDAGTLVYLERTEGAIFAIRDREGRSTPLELPSGTPGWPRISPDGRFAALHLGGRTSRDIWLLDLDRPGSTRQLTFQGGGFPTWSADGTRIAFMSRRGGNGDIFAVAADGSSRPERLLGGSRTQIPVSWSRDGVLAYYEIGDLTQRDIWVVDVDAGTDPVLFVATPANELSPVFSPDGRHLAYVSNETGQNEIYVRPYPPPGAVTAVSIDGGSEPVWSKDGSELFYRRGPIIMSVAVETDPVFRVRSPREVMVEPPLPGAGGNASYDRFPDGKRFLVRRIAPGSSIDRLRLVLNWYDELNELVPITGS